MSDARAASDRPPPPRSLRWIVLVLVSLTMFGNYYAYDAVGPLADVLKSQLHFDDSQIGTLNAIYSFPNIVMVLVGGVLVDRFGARLAILCFAAICALGGILTAVSPNFTVMAAGRLLFGVGSETMIVAITTALGQWFKGRELGFAFGVNLSIARAGSFCADETPNWFPGLFEHWQGPLLIAAGVGVVSLLFAVLYFWFERGAAGRFALAQVRSNERFEFRHVWSFDRSFWYVVGLCVTFYCVIFPFRSTFAIKYFQDAFHMTRAEAGDLNAWVFLAAIFATPAFGYLVDRVGRRSLFMLAGSLLLVPVFIGYVEAWDPVTLNVLIGISFSLVPAVMWPAVAYLVPAARLGTAYGLMTMIQNLGLTVANLAVGAMNDAASASATNPDGYLPMLWTFAVMSAAGVGIALLLRRRETGPHGHGLETVRAKDAPPHAESR